MENIPEEFNLIKTGVGYTMKGWDFDAKAIADALNGGRMLNPAMELGSNVCPLNCFFCFTEDPSNPEGLKQQLKGEMSLDKRLSLIDEAFDLGARTINFIGAGEPLFDPNFWTIVENMHNKGITPILYTEGTAAGTIKGLHVLDNAKRLYDLGATVVLKGNSLEDEKYQNGVVFSGDRKKSPLMLNYFQARQEVLDTLMEAEFNAHDPTRLAFDTIICRENIEEIPRIHRYARDNNIFVLFVNYLPSGRSSTPIQNAVSPQQQAEVFKQLADIDEQEYGIPHSHRFPYSGGVPCSIRGLGLHVKIRGDVWDCPGELQPLGNINEDSLETLWNKTLEIRKKFDGGCAPRAVFWRKHYGYSPDHTKTL